MITTRAPDGANKAEIVGFAIKSAITFCGETTHVLRELFGKFDQCGFGMFYNFFPILGVIMLK